MPTWHSKCGLQARLVVVFTIITFYFLVMLLCGCFHSKRPKKPVKKQVHIESPIIDATISITKLLAQKYNHSGELRAGTKKNHPIFKETKKKAAIRSRQLRVLRAKRLKMERETREEVAYIFQDVFPSDNGGCDVEGNR